MPRNKLLIDLSKRLEKTELSRSADVNHDIADHLGLTIETLHRTITALEKSGSIARAPHRTFII